jgi:hypothetical protein
MKIECFEITWNAEVLNVLTSLHVSRARVNVCAQVDRFR